MCLVCLCICYSDYANRDMGPDVSLGSKSSNVGKSSETIPRREPCESHKSESRYPSKAINTSFTRLRVASHCIARLNTGMQCKENVFRQMEPICYAKKQHVHPWNKRCQLRLNNCVVQNVVERRSSHILSQKVGFSSEGFCEWLWRKRDARLTDGQLQAPCPLAVKMCILPPRIHTQNTA